jgi:hypothetical protein
VCSWLTTVKEAEVSPRVSPRANGGGDKSPRSATDPQRPNKPLPQPPAPDNNNNNNNNIKYNNVVLDASRVLDSKQMGKRRNLVEELYSTELTYYESTQCMLRGYGEVCIFVLLLWLLLLILFRFQALANCPIKVVTAAKRATILGNIAHVTQVCGGGCCCCCCCCCCCYCCCCYCYCCYSSHHSSYPGRCSLPCGTFSTHSTTTPTPPAASVNCSVRTRTKWMCCKSTSRATDRPLCVWTHWSRRRSLPSGCAIPRVGVVVTLLCGCFKVVVWLF